MKKRILVSIFFISFIVASFTKAGDKIVLTQNNKTKFAIFIAKNADSLTNRAANELHTYIYKVSGAKLPLTHDFAPNKKYILLGKSNKLDISSLKKIERLNADGFIIKIDRKSIVIAGNSGQANLNGVYTFLEDFIDCTMLSLDEYYIPDNPNILLSDINKIYEPAFKFRKYFKKRPVTSKYMRWHKLNGLDDWGLFVHTFDDLVPPDIYYNEHPEYFALVNGRRLMDGQLCLSNQDLIKILKQNLQKEIEKKPDKIYWSVSQNDCFNYCECDNCKKLYKKYSSISGAYIDMANQLAQYFPNKIISTLAYEFTRSAPKNIKPLPNVNIMFCSIECDRSKPLATNERSKAFIKDLNDWTNLTNNIFMWDYVVQFKNYLTPFPNIKVLQPNLQLFRDKNIPMAFQQGSGKTWSDLGELKQYIISKLLWNPDENVDSLINDFLSKYYGNAAPFIKEYYELTHQSLYNHPEEWLNIYGFPMNYTDSYLTEELLIKYKSIMDKAESSVKNDSIFIKRVLRARLPVDFSYLDIALNGKFDKISYLNIKNGKKYIKKEMLEYLDRFVKNSILTGASIINERSFRTKDYKKYTLDKLNRMTKENLAKNAILKLKTKASPKYPAGNEKALVDGLFGDLDFHHNWLGFEGNDMIVEIDLKKVYPVSEIEMNFLKAVGSWIFLPVNIKIETSKDGVNYETAASVKGDNSNRNYLTKSIPFKITFGPKDTRYLRITATSMKTCPKWHRGFGKPSWIFTDEIIVN